MINMIYIHIYIFPADLLRRRALSAVATPELSPIPETIIAAVVAPALPIPETVGILYF